MTHVCHIWPLPTSAAPLFSTEPNVHQVSMFPASVLFLLGYSLPLPPSLTQPCLTWMTHSHRSYVRRHLVSQYENSRTCYFFFFSRNMHSFPSKQIPQFLIVFRLNSFKIQKGRNHTYSLHHYIHSAQLGIYLFNTWFK